MNASELIRKVRRIQIHTSRVTSEALAGTYHSAFRGRGVEFEEVRPYVVGDDVRTIDWNVSARAGAPHVKQFREERELCVMLAVDLSGSLDFGTRSQFKREMVAAISATISRLNWLRVPKSRLPERSTASITHSSRSSRNCFTCGLPARALTFQSMVRTSSPTT